MTLPDPHTYQQFSLQGDALADAAIEAIQTQPAPRGDLLARVEGLAEQGNTACQQFLEHVNTVPAWADVAAMQAGQQLFLRNAAVAIATFVLGSLLITYTPPGSARVLLHTGRLRKDVVRRLFETATMVRAVMQPGGLLVGGEGHRAIVRVRLLHAMVRHHVLASGHWPHAQLQHPIHQQQLGLTALGFSSLLMKGMARLGVSISNEEARSYQLLWRYGNWLQGVDIRLLPETLEDEAAMYDLYRRTLMQPDANSRTLVAAVHEGLAWQSPFFLPRAVLQAISRRILGAKLADELAIPRHFAWEATLGVLATLHRLTAWRLLIPGCRALEYRLGARYFNQLVDKGLQGQSADYALKTAR